MEKEWELNSSFYQESTLQIIHPLLQKMALIIHEGTASTTCSPLKGPAFTATLAIKLQHGF
jgi:hypothetical protein